MFDVTNYQVVALNRPDGADVPLGTYSTNLHEIDEAKTTSQHIYLHQPQYHTLLHQLNAKLFPMPDPHRHLCSRFVHIQ